ncbi:PucR family transcriptional regulator [Aquibacillus halophilus]|uniref:PucR family transcriptional regulator n=1 Tax=Aquibacillus halophilus TaxID=930132 RepID=A0A6A8DIP9_9BACI|nr:PucR family transcriptional regulator [Aquibacillus halophilus]
MKVSEILKNPAMEGYKIIAGESGLDREVLHVNMMDAPDIINFLKPNELLVTTAYHLKDQPNLIIELIEEMNEQGCAALGIKIKRFLQEIPKEVIEVAERLSFPIIELPAQSSLGDIVNQTLSSILDKKTNELRFAIDTHKQFSNHIISGKGIPKLLKRLADLINFPVVLLDQYTKPIASSHSNRKISHIMETMYLKDSSVYFPNTSFFTFSTLPEKETFSVFLVNTHQKKAGFLIVIGEINPADHSATLTIEQATNVISFELMKENALMQYTRRIKNEFFFNFTEGNFTSQEEVINRAKEFGLKSEQNYLCAAGKLEQGDFSGSYTQNQLEIDSIYEYIEDELVSLSLSTHLFTRGDTCILLYEVKGSSQDTTNYVHSSLELVQAKIKERFERSISFGVSNISRNFFHVKNGFKEAHDALQSGQLSGQTGFIQGYRTKDIMELLRIIPAVDLKDYYLNALQPLLELGKDEEQTLLQTLFVFLETHCQISETAKRLFVHRNTVVYRLDKCEELLGSKLNDSELTLQIRLAMRIKTMLDL